MAGKEIDLPIIDIAKAKTDREAEAKKVVEVLETVGFAFIDNAEGVDSNKMWEACQWFFGLPMEEKRKLLKKIWNSENHNVYRGYFPVIPGNASRKEGYDVSRDSGGQFPTTNWFYEQTPWPNEDGTLPFKKIMQEQYESLHETGLEILRLCALGLGIPENAFTDIIGEYPCSTFRMLHYPPWYGPVPANAITDDGKAVITPEHTDSGILTLLNPFHFGGLEIKMADGVWSEVRKRKGCLVMNIGDTLSRMVGGRFKATKHRVLDIGQERYSVPFFLEPTYDGDIGANILSKFQPGGPEHVYEHYGRWVLRTMKDEKKFYEFQNLPDPET